MMSKTNQGKMNIAHAYTEQCKGVQRWETMMLVLVFRYKTVQPFNPLCQNLNSYTFSIEVVGRNC